MSVQTPSRPAGASTPRAAPSEPLSDAVQWSEGMLLAPQHLQQADLFWQQQLRYRIAQLTPHYWGVAELVLDEVLLATGVVKLLKLECVMPDGTPVVYPGNYHDVALEVNVAAAMAASSAQASEPLRVSLVMPRRLGAGNQTAVPRHEVVHGQVADDENGGAGAVPVDRLRPRIQLWAGGHIPAHFQACALLEVARRVDAQRYELTPYHPPLLRWGAGEFLAAHGLPQRVRGLNKALWLKLHELGGDRRDDGPEDAALLGGDARRQLEMARRLATVLPRLGLLVARPEGNALAVYDALAEVAGAMASFGANPIVPMFEGYRHEDCEPQFRRAIDYIERKLGYVDTRHELLAFDRMAPGRFRRELSAHQGAELVVELRGPHAAALSDTERRDFESWLCAARIAAESLIGAARSTRNSARVRMLRPEECVQRHLRAGAAMFLIENDTLGPPMVLPGQAVVIEGQANGAEPAVVLQVLPRAPQAAPATRAAASLPVLGDRYG